VVIAQVVRPGTPVLFGGCPAIFDIRYETSPMGAVESMMLVCGASEIGRHLGLPTQGYVALSDAKDLDAQAGLETSMGATLAALSGVNSVSGPGMLDFINCFSLEKLVVDHEICTMARRLIRGMSPKDDFPATPLLRELLAEKHLLIADHTRRHLRDEITFPGWSIDRTSRSRWAEEGSPALRERAASEVKRLIGEYEPWPIPQSVAADLEERMAAAALAAGMASLPERNL
jgi:trimethylamine--corrinoid protein Co-methyltransferase